MQFTELQADVDVESKKLRFYQLKTNLTSICICPDRKSSDLSKNIIGFLRKKRLPFNRQPFLFSFLIQRSERVTCSDQKSPAFCVIIIS